MEKIELKQLSIGYPGKPRPKVVARGLNAPLYGGELTCLVGVNGAGKSTLLRTLAGFQSPLGGEVRLDGRSLSDFSQKELSRTTGVVLTEKVAVRDLPVRELAGMGRSPYTGFWGRLNRRDRAIVDDALRQAGIFDLAERLVDTLSDGERQKVLIAKVLAQQTPVILLDEPTAFLDFPSRVEMLLLLRNLSRETGKILLFSTHDLELAWQIADRCWMLDRTDGLTVGTPRELAANGSLERLFPCKSLVFDRQTGSFRIR
jgi:iron complex transport system ATP-binding protein